MEAITFESLPKAVSELNRKVDLLLAQVNLSQNVQKQEKLFTIEQFLEYLPEKPARQTVYGWVNDRSVPYEKYGKRLYFRQSIIEAWLSNGRKIG